MRRSPETRTRISRSRPQQTDQPFRYDARDPLATLPFSALGAVLRLASTLADAGDLQLPEVDTLVALQPELMARMELSAEDLVEYLQPWDSLTQGVDQLVS